MKVQNMVSESSGREVANQFIITAQGMTTFQSYGSTIIEIDHNKKTLTVFPDWDYSTTTGKYRNSFLRSYGFDSIASTAALKKAMTSGEKVNGYSIVIA